jgi:hypothetical protein
VIVRQSVTFFGGAEPERNLQTLSSPSRWQRKYKSGTCGIFQFGPADFELLSSED